MKLAFYFVCLFFLSFALKSESRELSRLEKSASTFMKRNLETLNELVRLTNVSDMSIPDYLSYQVLKKSCDPGVALLEQISKSQDLLDQSERLREHEHSCAQGLSGIASLYLSYK